MLAINPYLNFNGTTEEAFNLYKSVFGGEFAMIMRFKDSPAAATTPEKDQDKIMHIALPLANGTMLMATDAIGEGGMPFVTMGNNFSLAISAESREEADRLYSGLGEGGNPGSPMRDEFWGDYFGWVTDKFGINWMITHNPNATK